MENRIELGSGDNVLPTSIVAFCFADRGVYQPRRAESGLGISQDVYDKYHAASFWVSRIEDVGANQIERDNEGAS